MSHVKIWVLAVWGAKNNDRILTKDVRKKLFQHIYDNAKEKQIYINFINGEMDHIHCLLALNADMTIAKVIQLIKGEAAHWDNKNSIVKPELEWADEYFAVSVSESIIDKVRDYIKNQEVHHKKMTLRDEYEKFICKYGFKYHG